MFYLYIKLLNNLKITYLFQIKLYLYKLGSYEYIILKYKLKDISYLIILVLMHNILALYPLYIYNTCIINAATTWCLYLYTEATLMFPITICAYTMYLDTCYIITTIQIKLHIERLHKK